MRIVAQNRAAGGRAARRDRPIVAAVAGGMPISGRKHAAGELPKTAYLIPNRTGDGGCVIRVRRVERPELLRFVFQPFGNGDQIETCKKRRRKQKAETF